MLRLIPLFVFILCVISSNSQNKNEEITLANETPFLLGEIDKNGLTSKNYNDWFSENFNDYSLDLSTINVLSTYIADYEILVFMGTWCGDSKREIPRFYKILEACNFPMEQLRVIAVSAQPNMYKQSPSHHEAGLNIHRVPTFIFYKNRQEVNRIVEHPVASLEKDMLAIVNKNEYISNYSIVSAIDSILEVDGLNGLKKKHQYLVKNYKAIVTSMFELNTYGRILYSTNRNAEAIEVFKLNTLLFPEEPRTYMSLANTLGINGYVKESLQVIDEAIRKFPDNQDLKSNREALQTSL